MTIVVTGNQIEKVVNGYSKRGKMAYVVGSPDNLRHDIRHLQAPHFAMKDGIIYQQ